MYIDGTINCNPADRVKKPIKEVFVGSIYNSEELDQMFRVFRGDPLEQIVIFASYYGMRRSEIIGLKWKNIDFVRKTISVKHVVVESCIDGKLKMIKKDKPKTKSSNRSLPLVLHLIFFGYFANNTAWVAARLYGGISLVTTLPAPMTHPSPMVTPPHTTTLDASQQLSFIVIGFAYSRL